MKRVQYVGKHVVVLLGEGRVGLAIDVVRDSFFCAGGYTQSFTWGTGVAVRHLRWRDVLPFVQYVGVGCGRYVGEVAFYVMYA